MCVCWGGGGGGARGGRPPPPPPPPARVRENESEPHRQGDDGGVVRPRLDRHAELRKRPHRVAGASEGNLTVAAARC